MNKQWGLIEGLAVIGGIALGLAASANAHADELLRCDGEMKVISAVGISESKKIEIQIFGDRVWTSRQPEFEALVQVNSGLSIEPAYKYRHLAAESLASSRAGATYFHNGAPVSSMMGIFRLAVSEAVFATANATRSRGKFSAPAVTGSQTIEVTCQRR